MAAGGKEEKEKKIKEEERPKAKGKTPRRSPTARSGDAIGVSAKDGESYAEILKAMKAKGNPQNSRAEVLSIRRTRREENLLFLKKGGDVSAFKKALDQAVGENANVKSQRDSQRGPSKIGTSTRPSQGKRFMPLSASCWASQTSGTSAGCSGDRCGVRLGGSGGATCVQLLLFSKRPFRDLQDPDSPS